MRYFTPEEANEALATVRPLVEELVRSRRELRSRSDELAALRARVAGNGGGLDATAVAQAQEAADRAAAELHEAIRALDELGLQVKDLDRGLVDFPARHPDGETVLLCWELGEDEVVHWHGLEDGFAGRKPLPFQRTD